ncbi:Hypothetical protein ETEE_3947 [Edwardsiella anguillarum ET080813]|uniref:Uncharacterized protein n=1 Tax=Edwardsiella anguillarum ET080813 TaxID=667120 RepID=A0A076LQU0_9GAMM|nr:Hypothetical protein ETEE_3947 [Edwardsiella anguillarum ET080813]
MSATESLIPEMKVFSRGSINQSFIRHRTAGGKSLASTVGQPSHRLTGMNNYFPKGLNSNSSSGTIITVTNKIAHNF